MPYDYAVARAGELVLLIKKIDAEDLFDADLDEKMFSTYVGKREIPVLIFTTGEGIYDESVAKDISMALRNPNYAREHNLGYMQLLQNDLDEDTAMSEKCDDICCEPECKSVHIGRVKRIKLTSNFWSFVHPRPEDAPYPVEKCKHVIRRVLGIFR